MLIMRRSNGVTVGSQLSQDQVFFDGFGPVWGESRLMPQLGWVSRQTLYNGMGQQCMVFVVDSCPWNTLKQP